MDKHKFKGPRIGVPSDEAHVARYLGTAGITEEQTKALRWFFENEMRLLHRESEKEHAQMFGLFKVFVTGMAVMGVATLVYHLLWVWVS